MAKKQKMSAKQKQARIEAAQAREEAARAAKERKELWKRIGIAVVAVLLIAGLMVPTMAVSFCGNQRVEEQARQEAAEAGDEAEGGQSETLVSVSGGDEGVTVVTGDADTAEGEAASGSSPESSDESADEGEAADEGTSAAGEDADTGSSDDE